jgi:dihydrofolate reductase
LNVDGDTFFPDYAAKYDWQELDNEAHQAEPLNPYAYRFITLVKRAA